MPEQTFIQWLENLKSAYEQHKKDPNHSDKGWKQWLSEYANETDFIREFIIATHTEEAKGQQQYEESRDHD